MSADGFLQEIASLLERARIPFMLTGSMAAAVHGAGRATMNIDLVIEPTADQLQTFVSSFDRPGRYVSAEAATKAFKHESMFNVIDVSTGWKADLIIRKSRAFSQAEFARRQPMQFGGVELWVATREDLIVAKLEWARLGASARQIEDVANLLRVGGETVDVAYVTYWVDALQLNTQWDLARTESGHR